MHGVAGLRCAVADALADPDVSRYEYWPQRERPPARDRCGCGDPYAPGVVRWIECRCGVEHVRYRCARTGQVDIEPPHHEGCGPLPIDPLASRRM